METIKLSKKQYIDKVRACWSGKNIGGTLGMPHECKKHVLGLTFYEPIPEKPLPNDDLDLQLVWLQMLEEQGLDPELPVFAEYWNRHASSYPWNEYGFFMRNYHRGLRPPVAGCFENYFVDEMGSPIRSEIWACLHPADPAAAARMAWKDSAMDHAGGEGTFGEMFWAAVESAAFVVSEPMTLIRIGLNMIPLSSHIARSIREAVWCYENGIIWGDARERIVLRFGHYQPCNAIPNHGFTILGLLYGQDFGDKLLKAVNCGYDTDCTGATLGALLGIINGMDYIPQKWIKPVGDEIKLHKFTRGLNAPNNLDELTDRIVLLAEKAMENKQSVQLDNETILPNDTVSRMFITEASDEIRKKDIHSADAISGGRLITFHYGGEPVLRDGIDKIIRVTVDDRPAEVKLELPDDWEYESLGEGRFRISSKGIIRKQNTIRLILPDGDSVDFVMLGPDAAKGFAAGDNVKTCPKCHARIEACICSPSSARTVQGEK